MRAEIVWPDGYWSVGNLHLRGIHMLNLLDSMSVGLDHIYENMHKAPQCCPNPRPYWDVCRLKDGSPIDIEFCKSCKALLAVEWPKYDAA